MEMEMEIDQSFPRPQAVPGWGLRRNFYQNSMEEDHIHLEAVDLLVFPGKLILSLQWSEPRGRGII